MSTTHELARLLELPRLTHVVDIGANPVDGAPPYQPLLDAQLCRLTGFEPQDAALAELDKKKGANESYLPYAVGDGREHTLNLCAYSGWTSLFTPSAAALEVFSFFKANARVVDRTRIATQRLDDIAEVDGIDFLKIDIQGGELAVFVHGREKLKNAVVIQTEVQFVDLYEGQPSFGEVDQELRAQGFIPHAFAALKKWPIAPLQFGGNPTQPLNQLLEADIVYVRDFVHAERMASDQLKHLALIAHTCYGSFDLARPLHRAAGAAPRVAGGSARALHRADQSPTAARMSEAVSGSRAQTRMSLRSSGLRISHQPPPHQNIATPPRAPTTEVSKPIPTEPLAWI
jgi:FkbM family methyltransferase